MKLVWFSLMAAALQAQPPQQFADLGDFRVGYRTFGQLNAAKSNVVLFPTWFTGQSADLAAWIGPGKLADTDRFYVIAVDALANGVSTAKGAVTIAEMVRSQHLLLTKHFHLDHIYAVMGISMGGMQTFEWMTAYPSFFDRAVPIIGSPRLSSPDLLLWQAELSAIEAAGACRCDPAQMMEAVAAIHQFALTTPAHRARVTPREEWPKFKAGLAPGTRNMTPQDWATQLRAMMGQDVTRGVPFRTIEPNLRSRTLVVVASQDHMVNPGPALELARTIEAQTRELEGDCGHMAISCETPKLVAGVHEFLK